MTGSVNGALALLAAGLAVLIWPVDPPLIDTGVAGRTATSGSERTRGSNRIVAALRLYAPAVGLPLAVALLAPGLWWCGVIGAGPLAWYLGRRVGRPSAAQLGRRRRALAGRLDLIAACLRSGLPISSALSAVGAAYRDAPGPADGIGTGPVDVLDEVAAMLMVGADPHTAWRSAATTPELTSVAAAACRSAAGGTALAAAFTEQAEQLRRQNADAAATAAGRAGVLMTAPLGACFLPAFLCLGLAPAVVGLLGTLHLW